MIYKFTVLKASTMTEKQTVFGLKAGMAHSNQLNKFNTICYIGA